MYEVITRTLEQASDRSGDISEAVYQAFFQANPDAQVLMGHSDEAMRGRMLAQTIELLLYEDAVSTNNYLRWEVNNHVSAYAVHLDMYPPYLTALRNAVAESLGDNWGVPEAQAWDTRIATLLDQIYAV